MTVKTCNKCGAEVKNSLENCPECVTSLQDSNRSYKKVILFVLVLFNILMLAWALSGGGESAEIIDKANTVAGEEIAENSTVFGGSMLAVIWVVGDIFLGVLYFMAGKKR